MSVSSGLRLVLVIVALGAIASPGTAQPGELPDWVKTSWWMRRQIEPAWAIRGARVIDVATGEVSDPTDVVIGGDAIVAIGKAEGVAKNNTIDAAGGFVIPGLFDLHAHVLPESRRFAGSPPEETLKTLLEHGITTIRLLPFTSELALEWGASVAGAKLQGPTIVAASTLFEREAERTSQGFGTPEVARAWVEREAWLGARWIKVYNSMDESSLAAIVEAAHRHGLKVCGHTAEVPPHRAAVLGMDCFEHITGIPRSALDPALKPPRFDSLAERTAWYWENAQPERLERLLETMLENDVAWVPTLVVTDAMATHGQHDGSEPVPDDVRKRLKEANEKGARLAVDYFRRGGRVGVGTDFPVDGVSPGESVANEIRLLHEIGGATPLEALQIATLGSARVLGFESLVGKVEAGRLANLVVLNGNPLEDLKHLSDIRLVVHDGRKVE
ncbi:MAG: amidohydrolase family protein [Planctomycetota bacterium]